MIRLRIKPLLIAFGICLVIGLLGGAFAGRSMELSVIRETGRLTPAPTQFAGREATAPSSPVPDIQLNEPTPTPASPDLPATPVVQPASPTRAESRSKTGQKNILVIGIDDFHARDPHLESIWLVIYLQNSSHLKLLPIYPSSTMDSSLRENQQLELAFRLSPDLAPDPSFLSELQAKDLWWDNYAVLDKTGLAEFVEMISGADLEDGLEDGLRVVASLPSARENPKSALLSQTALMRALCRLAADSPPALEPSMAFDILAANMMTDLPAREAVSMGRNLLAPSAAPGAASGAGVTCEFPASHPLHPIENP